MEKIYLRHQCTMFQPMKYLKGPGGQNASEGHTKNSSYGQETRKYLDVFCVQLVKEKAFIHKNALFENGSFI